VEDEEEKTAETGGSTRATSMESKMRQVLQGISRSLGRLLDRRCLIQDWRQKKASKLRR
jgi:hypothetical protein